jgi:hypothetical protein
LRLGEIIRFSFGGLRFTVMIKKRGARALLIEDRIRCGPAARSSRSDGKLAAVRLPLNTIQEIDPNLGGQGSNLPAALMVFVEPSWTATG